jgi:hypothetical protein
MVSSAAAGGRTLSVSRTLDRIRSGFEPEVRLAKLQLELTAAPECGDLQCEERFGIIVTGLIFAMLSWLHGCESPRIEVRIDSPAPHALRMQMIQRLAPPPAHANTPGQASALSETLAFTSARAYAASQGGSFEIGPVGQRGALIQTVFNRPQFA